MWSRAYAACIICGETARPHFGNGKCRRCYLQEYNKAHSATVTASRRRWYETNIKATGRGKIVREQRNFGGMREAALERDGHACLRCGSTQLLTVHHKDGQGRGHPTPNNALSNLETLCRRCHLTIHRAEITSHRRKGSWSRGPYAECRCCGTKTLRNAGHGFCTRCIYHVRKAIKIQSELTGDRERWAEMTCPCRRKAAE